MDKKNTKELYTSPQAETLDLRAERIICESFDAEEIPGFDFNN